MQVNATETHRLIHALSFDVPIKYICPPALLALFVNQAIYDATEYENGYEDYPTWLQAVAGTVVLGTMFGSVALFAIYPGFWDVMGVDEDAGKPIAVYEPAVRLAPSPHCAHAGSSRFRSAPRSSYSWFPGARACEGAAGAAGAAGSCCPAVVAFSDLRIPTNTPFLGGFFTVAPPHAIDASDAALHAPCCGHRLHV